MSPDQQVASKVMRLHDALEDNDDVQHVDINLDLPVELLARLTCSTFPLCFHLPLQAQ